MPTRFPRLEAITKPLRTLFSGQHFTQEFTSYAIRNNKVTDVPLKHYQVQGKLIYKTRGSALVETGNKREHWSLDTPVIPIPMIERFPRLRERFPRLK